MACSNPLKTKPILLHMRVQEMQVSVAFLPKQLLKPTLPPNKRPLEDHAVLLVGLPREAINLRNSPPLHIWKRLHIPWKNVHIT